MRVQRNLILAMAVLSMLLAPAWAGPKEDAARAFTEGNRLLVSADFEGALRAFMRAAQDDPQMRDYPQQCALLRQVIQLRQALSQEQNPERWTAAARALRAFYCDRAVWSEAAAVDRQLHERSRSIESAALLGESLLELGRNAEADAVLSEALASGGPGATSSNPATTSSSGGAALRARLLDGIALARLGKLEQARSRSREAALPGDPAPDLLYHAARLQTLTDEAAGARALLTRALQGTAPSRLEVLRWRIRSCPDFASQAQAPEFAAMMQTASQVAESACSRGPSCGACPSRTAGCGAKAGGSGGGQ
jgi:tetratricopeptide (TPR) repeat protein